MSLTDLCRLCLAKEKLVWVFGDTFESEMPHMKYVVFVATGVEIDVTDKISQKMCERCCQLVLKIFEFRKTSLQCNKYLKAQLKNQTKCDDGCDAVQVAKETHIVHKVLENNKALVEVQTKPSTVEHPSTDKAYKVNSQIKDNSVVPEETYVGHAPLRNNRVSVEIQTERCIAQHPSVDKLYKLNSNLLLPIDVLHLDVEPRVVLKMDQVENYFKKRKLDFQAHSRLALKRKRTETESSSKSRTDQRLTYTIENGVICLDTEKTEEVVHPLKIRITSNILLKEKLGERQNTIPSCNKENISDLKASLSKENEKRKVSQAKIQSSPVTFNESKLLPLLRKYNICDSIPNTTEELKIHLTTLRNTLTRLKHERWKKSAINRFPCIELTKIEDNVDIMKNYAKELCIGSSAIQTELESIETVVCGTDTKKQIPAEENTTNKTLSQKEGTKIELVMEIKDSVVLNTIEQDPKKMLKNLLLYYRDVSTRPLVAQKKVQVQQNVNLYSDNATAVLTQFKQELQKYVIPVTIRNGSFNASFDYSGNDSKRKNLKLWHDLTPIDVKQGYSGSPPPTTEPLTSPLAGTVASDIYPSNHNMVSQSIQRQSIKNSSNDTTQVKITVLQPFTSKTIGAMYTPSTISTVVQSPSLSNVVRSSTLALSTSSPQTTNQALSKVSVSNGMRSLRTNTTTRNLNATTLKTPTFPNSTSQTFTSKSINPTCPAQSFSNSVISLHSTNIPTSNLHRTSPETHVSLAVPTNSVTTLPYNYHGTTKPSLHAPINSVADVTNTYWSQAQLPRAHVVSANRNSCTNQMVPVDYSLGYPNYSGMMNMNTPRTTPPSYSASTSTCPSNFQNSKLYHLLYPPHSEISNMVPAPTNFTPVTYNTAVPRNNCNGQSYNFNIRNSAPRPVYNVYNDVCSTTITKTSTTPTLSSVNSVSIPQHGHIRVKNMSELI